MKRRTVPPADGPEYEKWMRRRARELAKEAVTRDVCATVSMWEPTERRLDVLYRRGDAPGHIVIRAADHPPASLRIIDELCDLLHDVSQAAEVYGDVARIELGDVDQLVENFGVRKANKRDQIRAAIGQLEAAGLPVNASTVLARVKKNRKKDDNKGPPDQSYIRKFLKERKPGN